MEKVRNSEEKPAVPDRPATSKPPAQPAKPTASDILGLKQPRTKGRQQVSLEMEVDQYLSNPDTGTSILDFWQVVITLSIIFDFSQLTNL